VVDIPTLVNTPITVGIGPSTVQVLSNPGAGFYTATNTIVGTNTTTRLASVVAPGWSWDLNGSTFSDGTTFPGTATVTVGGITFPSGQTQSEASPADRLVPFIASQGRAAVYIGQTFAAQFARYRYTNTTGAPIYGLKVCHDIWQNSIASNPYGGEFPVSSVTNACETITTLIYPAGGTNAVFFLGADGSEIIPVSPLCSVESQVVSTYINPGTVYEINCAISRVASSTNLTPFGHRGTLLTDGSNWMGQSPGVQYSSAVGVTVSEDAINFAAATYAGVGTNMFSVLWPYLTGNSRTLSGYFGNSIPTHRPIVVGYGPASSRLKAIGLVGDSNTRPGSGETVGYSYQTVLERAFYAHPFYNAANAGEGAIHWNPIWSSNESYRARRLRDCGYIVDAMGANDLATNSVATMQATWIAHIQKLGLIGKVIACDVFPRASSTDLFVTETNQTPISATVRSGFQAWLTNAAGNAAMLYTNGAWVATTAGTVGAVYPGPGHPLNLVKVLPLSPAVESTVVPGAYRVPANPVVWTGTLSSGTTNTLVYTSSNNWPTVYGQGSYTGLVLNNTTRGATARIGQGNSSGLNSSNFMTLVEGISGQTNGDSAQILYVPTRDNYHLLEYAISNAVNQVWATLGTNSDGTVKLP